MTCVLAVRDDEGIVLAGDSCAGSEWIARPVATSKVFVRYIGAQHVPIGIGYTSSFRMGQLLQHYPIDIVCPVPGDDLLQWTIRQFIPWARDLFLKEGFAEKRENQESGGTFLVVVLGHIFRIDENYQVLENTDPYDAIGSGYMYALGALRAIDTTLPALERAKVALDIATYYSPWVTPPYSRIIINRDGNVVTEGT